MSDKIKKIAPADIIARAIKHHQKKNSRSPNLIDVAKSLPKNGVGSFVKRENWPDHMYYTLTKVKVHHVNNFQIFCNVIGWVSWKSVGCFDIWKYS